MNIAEMAKTDARLADLQLDIHNYLRMSNRLPANASMNDWVIVVGMEMLANCNGEEHPHYGTDVIVPPGQAPHVARGLMHEAIQSVSRVE